jgi:antirestriction protein ArdC
MKLFDSAEEFYATSFHELVHSTGHKSRLDRPEITHEGIMLADSYSKEELVAEMGAAFLANICGIDGKTFNNSVAYVQGWMKRIKDDKRLIVKAASQAQKAADFIQNKLNVSGEIAQEKEEKEEKVEEVEA